MRPVHRRSEARAAPSAPGLPARAAAADLVHGVLAERRPLDQLLDPAEGSRAFLALPASDRALARAIAGASLRRLGTLRAALAARMPRGLPRKAGRLEAILLTAAAQLLLLEVPAHAAVDLAVRLARTDDHARHFAALVNAVLRGIAADGLPAEPADGVPRDTPDWLFARWAETYGEDVARGIAAIDRTGPALDITVKADAAAWAERLGGIVLPTGSVRLIAKGPISALPGYDEGAWWVQDAAAALPARLLEARPGERIADLCAAPGGKTAQLALAGAEVMAVDRSGTRLARLVENLGRLKLTAAVVEGDARSLEAGPFDAVLLDAPCSATGTIRRHPDVAWLKRPADIASLVPLQAELLDAAVRMLRPGGRLVYAVCSLEAEEGERQIEGLLARNPEVVLDPVRPGEAGLPAAFIAGGMLRTLPVQLPNAVAQLAGLEGFFAARLRRR